MCIWAQMWPLLPRYTCITTRPSSQPCGACPSSRDWGKRELKRPTLCGGIPTAGALVRGRCFAKVWRRGRTAELGGLEETSWPWVSSGLWVMEQQWSTRQDRGGQEETMITYATSPPFSLWLLGESIRGSIKEPLKKANIYWVLTVFQAHVLTDFILSARFCNYLHLHLRNQGREKLIILPRIIKLLSNRIGFEQAGLPLKHLF